jgi:transcriptional repressor NrdR
MKCPMCGYNDSKVIDSRPVEENDSIRRRRECLKCQHRFTTYEVIEAFQPLIIKKDGSKEYFDKNKLLVGLLKACEKRPVDAEAIAAEIEAEVMNSLHREISSREIGEMAMEKLRRCDAVAYVRFASVYRQFKDVSTFIAEIEKLLGSDSAGKKKLKKLAEAEK